MNFTLTAFAGSHRFLCICAHFCFKILLWFFHFDFFFENKRKKKRMSHSVFYFYMLVNFQLSPCWILVSYYRGWRRYLFWFQSCRICKDLFCDRSYDLSWIMFHVHVRRMCALPLDGMFSKCLLSPFGLTCSVSPVLMILVWIYPLLKVGYWSLLLFFYCCLFLPSGLLVFAYYIQMVKWWVHIDCCIFLMKWPLYCGVLLCMMTFFVSLPFLS